MLLIFCNMNHYVLGSISQMSEEFLNRNKVSIKVLSSPKLKVKSAFNFSFWLQYRNTDSLIVVTWLQTELKFLGFFFFFFTIVFVAFVYGLVKNK